MTKSVREPGMYYPTCSLSYSHRFHITPAQFREPYKTSLWEKDMHSHKKGTVDSTYTKIRHACYDTCKNADIHVITHVRNSGIHAMIHLRNSPIHAVQNLIPNAVDISTATSFSCSHRFHITPPQFRKPYKTSLWEKGESSMK